ncbi:MAG: Mur ligase family protein, partial [Candidatus Omnitrophota bacterium]
MSYIEVIKYLNSFVNYEKNPGPGYKEALKLERVVEFLKIIGNPQKSFKSVHVAGTKGKGSVCAFSAYILRECGFKVGLFTSPHLTDVRERIRILRPDAPVSLSSPDVFEGMIPKQDLMDLATRLKSKIDKFCAISQYGPLTFFEVYTIFAFEYFKEQEVDFAVLETGLGGRLDATNVVEPVICGISSISYDHTQELGNTLAEIAEEKAGIIKSSEVLSGESGQEGSHNLIVVSAPQEEEVLGVLKKRCAQEGARFYGIGEDIKFELLDSTLDYQEFSIKGNLGKFNNLRIKFLGRHQLVNAALAVSLVSGIAIRERFGINLKMFKKGLERTFWPARFERISL